MFRGLVFVAELMVVLIVVITASPLGFISLPFIYNDMPSLPHGFYHAEEADTLVIGDILRVCAPER